MATLLLLLLAPLALAKPQVEFPLNTLCVLESVTPQGVDEGRAVACGSCWSPLAHLWLSSPSSSLLPSLAASCSSTSQEDLRQCLLEKYQENRNSVRVRRSLTLGGTTFSLGALGTGGLGLAGLTAGLNSATLSTFTGLGLAGLVTG